MRKTTKPMTWSTGSGILCIENLEALPVWGEVQNLNQPQKSEVLLNQKVAEHETMKMVGAHKRFMTESSW